MEDNDDDAFEAMAEICIAAGQAVMENGTADMQMAMRALLFRLGEEIVRREASHATYEGAA